MGMLTGCERCGIIATHFPEACAVRSHAVILAHDADIGRFESGLEVRPYGCDKNHKQIFRSGLDPYLSRHAQLDRTDVKRRARTVRGHKTLVELHHFYYHLLKQLLGQRFHKDTLGRLAKTACILFEAEDTDFTILASEGLQALEYLLSVMQTGGGDMHVHLFALRDFYLAPLAVTIIATYIVICWDIAK